MTIVGSDGYEVIDIIRVQESSVFNFLPDFPLFPLEWGMV